MMALPALALASFLAGVLTFLAPCTLPLVPGYLGFISNVAPEDIARADAAALRRIRRRIVRNGAAFVAGFSVVFVALGTLVGLVGSTILAPYRLWLTRGGGIVVIVFGLMVMGVVRIPALSREYGFRLPRAAGRGGAGQSFLVGSAFALGWTPCVGPVLGSVLLLTSSSATALEGAVLLLVFSLGLAVPFLALAWGVGSAAKFVKAFAAYLRAASLLGGAFLVGIGVLLFFDKMQVLISGGFAVLRWLGYERILEFL